MKNLTDTWFRMAETDMEIAEDMADETNPPIQLICSLCCQAAREYLNGLYSFYHLESVKTTCLE